jgi:hypothetical protein
MDHRGRHDGRETEQDTSERIEKPAGKAELILSEVSVKTGGKCRAWLRAGTSTKTIEASVTATVSAVANEPYADRPTR